ncbi:MAG TPA: prepilin-type N-terminal cleavage/methylation domain-containing protein [Rhizomicrobium sp.]|jgi:general secretion pathway protein J
MMVRASGFTLLELMVTLTLLSLLSLLLFGGLRLGARAWDRSEARGTGMDELHVVQNLLRREIEQAYPYYVTTDPVHPTVDFSGGPSEIDFLAPAPQALSSPGRSRIAFAAMRDGSQMMLAIRARPELAASPRDTWNEPLLHGLAAVRFSYFGTDDPRAAPTWRNSWTGAKTLPRLVRVDVRFPKDDGRVWPDFVVAPRIEADANCVYDYTTQHCTGRP